MLIQLLYPIRALDGEVSPKLSRCDTCHICRLPTRSPQKEKMTLVFLKVEGSQHEKQKKNPTHTKRNKPNTRSDLRDVGSKDGEIQSLTLED